MVASRAYRQLGKTPLLVMCARPKTTEAVNHPAVSFEKVFEREFCSNPRNNNSSGQAVSKKMETASEGKDFQCACAGSNRIKCNAVPRGITMMAIHAK